MTMIIYHELNDWMAFKPNAMTGRATCLTSRQKSGSMFMYFGGVALKRRGGIFWFGSFQTQAKIARFVKFALLTVSSVVSHQLTKDFQKQYSLFFTFYMFAFLSNSKPCLHRISILILHSPSQQSNSAELGIASSGCQTMSSSVNYQNNNSMLG